MHIPVDLAELYSRDFAGSLKSLQGLAQIFSFFLSVKSTFLAKANALLAVSTIFYLEDNNFSALSFAYPRRLGAPLARDIQADDLDFQ